MESLYQDQPYERSCIATVLAVGEQGIELDKTVFYPTGGGQAGDVGSLRASDGTVVPIVDTVKGGTPGSAIHVPAEGAASLPVGTEVTAEIDWERRHRLMRMHTCLHLLSAVLAYPVTGGQVSDGKGRLDFDMPDMPMTKEEITDRLNALVEADHPVNPTWISDDDLSARPELVKTMSVKPPMGQGRVRLIEIEGQDLQPCGGTHVQRTGEIGRVRVRKIEKKGRQNRRVNLVFDDGEGQ
jgi:misacylated tRNA(Ala) deacylase